MERDSLLQVVRQISDSSQKRRRQEEDQKKLEEAYLEQLLIALLYGRADEQMLHQISGVRWMEGLLRYVSVECLGDLEENNEDEERPQQESFYALCQASIPADAGVCVRDFSQEQRKVKIGMILPAYLVEGGELCSIAWLRNLKNALENQGGISIRFLAGKAVSGPENLSKSYTSCVILRSMTSFREGKELYLYEEELQVRGGSIRLYKPLMDSILDAVRGLEREKIHQLVKELYQELERSGLNSDSFKRNIHYLLFQLVHLANSYDDKVDQAYIAAWISDSSFVGDVRGGSRHLEAFLLEYADYLTQLSGNTSSSVLIDVEREIRENYSQNLTLRELGERYYLNSSYLGQIFHRKYGISFKDYLNQVRIQAATDLLLHIDKKITVIAEEISYKDKNYFLRKFIELKGCTPTKYRRSHQT